MSRGSTLDHHISVSAGGPIRAVGGKGIAPGMVESLGRCAATNRGEIVWLRGASGAADTYAVCRKDAADAFTWAIHSESTHTHGSTFTLGPWHANDLAGTASRFLQVMFMDTSTTVVQANSTLLMPAAGAVIAAFLSTDGARTAGTATLRVTINGVPTTFLAGAVVLDATNTSRDSAYDATGLAFASGDTIGVNVITSGWTPTTANVTAWLVMRLSV